MCLGDGGISAGCSQSRNGGAIRFFSVCGLRKGGGSRPLCPVIFVFLFFFSVYFPSLRCCGQGKTADGFVNGSAFNSVTMHPIFAAASRYGNDDGSSSRRPVLEQAREFVVELAAAESISTDLRRGILSDHTTQFLDVTTNSPRGPI